MQKPTCHRFHRLTHVETVHRPLLVSWLLPFSPQAMSSVLWKPLPQASLSSWGYSELSVGLLNSGQASLFNLCDLKTNSWQSFSFFFFWVVWWYFRAPKLTPYTKVGGKKFQNLFQNILNSDFADNSKDSTASIAPLWGCKLQVCLGPLTLTRVQHLAQNIGDPFVLRWLLME